MNDGTCLVTGADAAHFANSKLLVASWRQHNPELPLLYCDFGLQTSQREALLGIGGLRLLLADELHGKSGWECKSNLHKYLEQTTGPDTIVVWVDADAILLRPLQDIAHLIDGYDMIIDVHVQSVGEIMTTANMVVLGANPTDAYFSSGFWMVRHPSFLKTWARLTENVKFQGNLWENDAFVAAIYHERLKIRPVNGNIWHCRGMTSLDTCQVRGGHLFFGEYPVQVLHANAGFTIREDGRRVFKREDLAAIQDRYEALF